MEDLIPVASKLQDVLGALGQNTTLDLPQIVVVGGQSSGKSSVLEGVVGRSFLPRGHGIVTRRPLVLQLYNTSSPVPFDEDDEEEELARKGNAKTKNEIDTDTDTDTEILEDHATDTSYPYSSDLEWGEFLHLPGKRFNDFAAIRKEIIRDTERLTGKNRGINPTPIHLKIYSPRVLALTLVDLPGMAKVAVGDQPPDIEEQIRDMSLKYISNPNAIILAVTPANTDPANSDSIKLAREADPLGNRTVGVLTKLDLMDPGTDATDILNNRVVPLRRGYIAVVNRGQKDVDTDLSVREGLRKEERFFRSHPKYSMDRSLAAKCGTANLAKSLNAMLMHHIRECLPELKSRITNMTSDVQSELESLGTPTDQAASMGTLGGHLLTLLGKFATNFSNTIEGRECSLTPVLSIQSSSSTPSCCVHHASKTQQGPTIQNNINNLHEANELYGGARISYIFTDIFSQSLLSVLPFDGLQDDEIRTTIRNANGTRPSLFVPEMSFDILVRRQISRLELPGLQCVELVYEELQRIASQCEPTELTRFPHLRERIVTVVSDLLRRAVAPTQIMVSNLIKIELAYINTSHPDFIGGSRAVTRLMQKVQKEKEFPIATSAGTSTGIVQNHMNGNGNNTIEQKGKSENGSNSNSTSNPNTNAMDTEIGATPLSSSSLNNYAHQNNQTPDHGTGSIMNFIFGGTGGGKQTPTNPRSNINGNLANPTHNTANAYQTPSRQIDVTPNNNTNANTNIGPPRIVQLPQVPDAMHGANAPPSDRERIEMEIIKSLIESYFSIVRMNFIDMVPKTIMYFLVNHVRDAMQNELVEELYRDHEVPSLMKEADDVAQRRKTCMEMKELLSKALEIVNEVRDYNAYK
mmetsp:Transcript_18703/g.26342  ORF Transcript_18703/g.26342 Transcript_18703/m.26342 type:complete len:864 (+) Transcript_18703:54-2645(+)|eukprot:CAMPEP_0184873182 /NCGR_PEP_ID=MMETSP0580-20130426/41699_1 /TAXON_ID=1118495 /ORGANISM="Dactyliosolen fragilissimus" /LENGTH=863 /DNA_ID=CAMNT_0027376057 /DNA_START=32 /DNA_END=2623 /DNA_ORIENTATION=-